MQNVFQCLQVELEQMEDLFKVISKKFQVLIKDLTRDEVSEMMLCIKREKGALDRNYLFGFWAFEHRNTIQRKFIFGCS